MNPGQYKSIPLPQKKRNFFLSLICLFSWVYFSILSVIFISGLIYSGWVTEAINLYAAASLLSKTHISLILGVNAILHMLAFAGTIMMWNLKRRGYYLFGISVMAICVWRLFMPSFSFSMIIIYIVLLILFGLFFRHFR